MVKKITIKIFYLFFFFIALLYFLPKEHLYYLLQKEFKEQKITLTQESLQEKAFGVVLENVTVSYEGIPVGTIKHLHCTMFLFYNEVQADDIILSSLAKSYLPPKLSFVTANYSVLHPLSINVASKGAFGSLHVTGDIKEKKVFVELKPSHILQTQYTRSLKYLKREKNGEYSYAKSFK